MDAENIMAKVAVALDTYVDEFSIFLFGNKLVFYFYKLIRRWEISPEGGFPSPGKEGPK